MPSYLYRVMLMGDVTAVCHARGYNRAFFIHGHTYVECRATCPAQARLPFLAVAPVADVWSEERGA